MTTTLITGAYKGLGKETARFLLEVGHTVWIGARDEARGRAAAVELGARFVQLDVRHPGPVDANRTFIFEKPGNRPQIDQAQAPYNGSRPSRGLVRNAVLTASKPACSR